MTPSRVDEGWVVRSEGSPEGESWRIDDDGLLRLEDGSRYRFDNDGQLFDALDRQGARLRWSPSPSSCDIREDR